MAELTYFTVVGAYYASLVDSYDVDTDPDLVPLFGRIRFTPLVDAGDVVKAQTLTPPTNLLLKPIEAEVKAGVVWSNGSEGVKLPANTAVLELAGALYYQVDFPDGLTARGTQYQVDSFPFLAPTTAVTIDLSEVTPMPGQPATGPVPTSAVLSFNGRTGYIVATAADVDAYTVAETDTAIAAAINALIAGAPGALDTLNELAAALGDDANFATTITNALAAASATLAREHNSGPNLLMDGSYEQDATWWAGEIGTGKALSTDQAYFGSQSFKITGGRALYLNVTAAGKTGFDATYGYIKSGRGRAYRVSFRVWRSAGNTTSGFVRGLINCVGAGGTDAVAGTLTLLQTDFSSGQWYEYVSYFTVPNSGANAPYSNIYPYIVTQSVNSADVFYVDNVRFEDITSAPFLTAPAPTGDRTTDTLNLQRLSDWAQNSFGTVFLRPGTYAADIVTAKLDYQPRIVGPGKVQCKIDGTIKMQGNSSKFSGGWLSGFSFTGSHAGQAALELNGVCDVHWDEIRVEGTYDVGIWFHNELSGDYAEVCNGTMDFYINCTTALKYTVGAGTNSFHGSGLTGASCIQQSSAGPAVLIESLARPYNAPLSARVWTSTNTYPVIQHNGDAKSNFFGNLTVEQIGTAALAAGTPIYYAGTLSTYMGPGLSLNKGTFTQVVAGVQSVSGGSLTPLPINVASGGELDLYNTADQVANYERAFIRWIANVLTISAEKGGTGTQRNLALVGHGQIIMQAGQQGPTLGTISMWDNAGVAGAATVGITGIGSAASGLQYGLSISPNYQQSSTAGYTVLLINPTETTTGSGAKKLIDAQVSGSSKFTVDSTGKVTLSGTAATVSSGTGTPEGSVTAPVGSTYTRTDGAAGTTFYAKESGSGNTGWVAYTRPADVQVFTLSGTWTKPAGAVSVRVRCIGPGSGGGAGARGPSGTALAGGGGGGTGAMSDMFFAAADLTSTVAVTIATGGAGGVGQTVDGTAGASGGNASGSTTFGAYLQAARGGPGVGGGLAAGGTAGGRGSGLFLGGTGGTGSTTGAVGGTAGTGPGPGGGGAGGGITTGGTANAGGAGGVPDTLLSLVTAAAGGTGANGTAGTASTTKGAGSGGGGGGANAAGAGFNGGNGGSYGSGGGGGGASLNGSASGAGGNGADGICVVTTYF